MSADVECTAAGEQSGQSDATKGQKPDIYGQVHPIETAELVERKYREFQTELSKVVEENVDFATNNLQKAMKLCPECFTYEFQVKFLQCEVYNVRLAIKRYINYFNKRFEILGEQMAFCKFNIMSLDPEVLYALEAGVIHVIHRPDPNDRTLLYVDYSNFHSKINRRSFIVALWYLLHVMAIDDPECPKKGAIIIADAGRFQFSQCDKALIKLIINSIKECLPIRLSAYHLCYPPTFVSFFIPIVFLFLAKRLKQRLIVHSGNKNIVINQLSDKYHIEAQHLPTQVGGTLEINMELWIQNRKLIYGVSDLWSTLENNTKQNILSTITDKNNSGNGDNNRNNGSGGDSNSKQVSKSLPLTASNKSNRKSTGRGLVGKSLQQQPSSSHQHSAAKDKASDQQTVIGEGISIDGTVPVYLSCSSTESSLSNCEEVGCNHENNKKEQSDNVTPTPRSCIVSVQTLFCGSFFPLFDKDDPDQKDATKQQRFQLEQRQLPELQYQSPEMKPLRQRLESSSTVSSTSTTKSQRLRSLITPRLKRRKDYASQQTM